MLDPLRDSGKLDDRAVDLIAVGIQSQDRSSCRALLSANGHLETFGQMGGMNTMGIQEIFGLSVAVGFWLVTVIAAIWALITLHRVRVGQEAMRAKLEAIERLLQRT
jgi:hypothetical protein